MLVVSAATCVWPSATGTAAVSRRLGRIEFPYVYLDAACLNVRNSVAQPASMAAVAAAGITSEASREVLGRGVGDSESEGFWQQFPSSLRHRGLGGVQLVIPDAHSALTAAAGRRFQGRERSGDG